MFFAGHCSTLMTVGWAWLAKSRICLVRQYWLWGLLTFFICLHNKRKKRRENIDRLLINEIENKIQEIKFNK
jgi:hypothetical protein